MIITFTIETGNAAFTEQYGNIEHSTNLDNEVSRIINGFFDHAGDNIADYNNHPLYDLNGNKVGLVTIDDTESPDVEAPLKVIQIDTDKRDSDLVNQPCPNCGAYCPNCE